MKSRTSSSSYNNKTGLVLTLEQFITAIPSHTVNPKDIKNTLEKHSLAKKQIISLPPTGLAYFANLRHLDLSDNLIQDLSPLSHMPSLRHLNLSKNKVSDLAPLATLHKTLMVLDVSSQKDKTLSSLSSMFTTSSNNNSKSKNKSTSIIFSNLKTIIATDNDLLTLGFYGPAENLQLINRKQDFEKEVEEENQKKGGAKSAGEKSVFDKNDINKIQSPLPVLETLILSRNPTLGNQQPPQAYHHSANETEIDLWGSLHLVSSSLRKLSLSDCGLQHPLPQHLSLPLVTELRLAKNHFCTFPKTIRFKSLQILDVSHNQFESLDSVARFPFLKHLSVAGNPAMMNTNKHGDTLASSSSASSGNNKTLSKKMNEFLAFLYLFFKDLHTVDGKKFDREVVKASLDKNLVRQIKLRVIRGEQEEEEEEKEETQKQEKKNKIEKDNDDDEELDFDDEGFLPEDFLDDDDEEDEEDDFSNQNGDDDDQLLGHNDDDDDDGANDPTILMRRRRRREDSDDEADDGGMDKKRSNNKKKIVVKGQINSDDEEAIDADDFLKGTSNTKASNSLSEMAAKSIQSIKRRAPTTTLTTTSSNNNSKGGNKNKNNAVSTSSTTTDSATVIAALQKAAANSKTIAQW